MSDSPAAAANAASADAVTSGVTSADAVAARLGMARTGADSLVVGVRGREVLLRSLHSVEDVAPVEELQRQVMGATDLDVHGRATLVAIPSTGGHVIGAYVRTSDGAADGGWELAGAVIGFGGFVRDDAGVGTPTIVSDWMGVWPRWRSAGLGAALKRAQMVHALAGGFERVEWTVDPLRAANARLNHGILGAAAVAYAEDRYGTDYAAGLYGGLPSDRLVLRWSIADPAVQDRVVDPPSPRTVDDLRNLDDRRADGAGSPLVGFVEIPPDIDALLAADPPAALHERERVRSQLTAAFAAGAEVVDFAAAGRSGRPALVLAPRRDRS